MNEIWKPVKDWCVTALFSLFLVASVADGRSVAGASDGQTASNSGVVGQESGHQHGGSPAARKRTAVTSRLIMAQENADTFRLTLFSTSRLPALCVDVFDAHAGEQRQVEAVSEERSRVSISEDAALKIMEALSSIEFWEKASKIRRDVESDTAVEDRSIKGGEQARYTLTVHVGREETGTLDLQMDMGAGGELRQRLQTLRSYFSEPMRKEVDSLTEKLNAANLFSDSGQGMSETASVLLSGVEFQVVGNSEWIVPSPGKTTFAALRLRVTNRGQQAVRLNWNQTLAISLHNAQGQRLPLDGHVGYSIKKPSLIEPGHSVEQDCSVTLSWDSENKSRLNATGVANADGRWRYMELLPGEYSLAMIYESTAQKAALIRGMMRTFHPDSTDNNVLVWVGTIQTSALPIKLHTKQ